MNEKNIIEKLIVNETTVRAMRINNSDYLSLSDLATKLVFILYGKN